MHILEMWHDFIILSTSLSYSFNQGDVSPCVFYSFQKRKTDNESLTVLWNMFVYDANYDKASVQNPWSQVHRKFSSCKLVPPVFGG